MPDITDSELCSVISTVYKPIQNFDFSEIEQFFRFV